jgi:outer membrane receptor for ferrienterochelin and colicin
VDTALNRMPQFVAQYTNTSNNPANWGRANVQLRGLGGESTLVLLNGRRLSGLWLGRHRRRRQFQAEA